MNLSFTNWRTERTEEAVLVTVLGSFLLFVLLMSIVEVGLRCPCSRRFFAPLVYNRETLLPYMKGGHKCESLLHGGGSREDRVALLQQMTVRIMLNRPSFRSEQENAESEKTNAMDYPLVPNIESESSVVSRLPRRVPAWMWQVCQDWRGDKRFSPDAEVMIRFLQLGFKFSICGCILDMFLLPMYFTGGGSETGYQKYSMLNLKKTEDDQGDPRFWGVIIAAYILIFVLCQLILREWRHVLAMRREYYLKRLSGMEGSEAAQATRSLLVEEIPAEGRTTEAVTNFMEKLFGPGSVVSVVFQEHENVLLSAFQAKFQGSPLGSPLFGSPRGSPKGDGTEMTPTPPSRRRLVNDTRSDPSILPCGGDVPSVSPFSAVSPGADRVEATETPEAPQAPRSMPVHHSPEGGYQPDESPLRIVGRQLQKGACKAARILQGVTVGSFETSTAIVTLRRASNCLMAQQVVVSHDSSWSLKQAPEPRDIVWPNVSIPPHQIRHRSKIVFVICLFFLLFWSLVLAGIQWIFNIRNFAKQFNWDAAKELENSAPKLFELVTTVLPVGAFISLQTLVPRILECVAVNYEGLKVKSDVQRYVFRRTFGFGLASLYSSMVLTEEIVTLLKVVEDTFESPQRTLLVELASRLPKFSDYFTTEVLFRVGWSLPCLLLRPWDYIFLCGEEPVVDRIALGNEAATATVILVIGLTYSFVAPAICVPCALYFGIGTIIYRWLLAHVYVPDSDGGGEIWLDLYCGLFFGMLLGTLALTAASFNYGDSPQRIALFPLPVIVMLFGGYCWNGPAKQCQFSRLQEVLAVEHALGEWQNFDEHLYVSPNEKKRQANATMNKDDCKGSYMSDL